MINFLFRNGSEKKKAAMEMNYEKYRWFFTSSGKLVVGGKSSNQNEEIMQRADKDTVIMHTSSPGSPFCIVDNPNTKDIEETAIFTACFSQEWKKKKKKTEIHIFKGEQVVKKSGMKQGTFGITGSVHKKKVDLKLGLGFQKGKLRSAPISALKQKLGILTPGNLDKNQAIAKVLKIIKDQYGYPITQDEVAMAIPSDNIDVKKG